MPVATPKWKDITASGKWSAYTPDKQNEVRERWLTEVNTQEPNWTEEQRQELRAGVFKDIQKLIAAPTTQEQIAPTIQEQILQEEQGNIQRDLMKAPTRETPGELISPETIEFLKGLPLGVITGPGSKEFMETIPGGKFAYGEAREEFVKAPLISEPRMPSKEDLLQIAQGKGMRLIAERLKSKEVAQTKVVMVMQELYKGLELYTVGKGFQAGAELLKVVPRIEKIMRYPLETLFKQKKTVIKEIDTITKTISRETLSGGEKKIVDDLGRVKKTLQESTGKDVTPTELDAVEKILGDVQAGKVSLASAEREINKAVGVVGKPPPVSPLDVKIITKPKPKEKIPGVIPAKPREVTTIRKDITGKLKPKPEKEFKVVGKELSKGKAKKELPLSKEPLALKAGKEPIALKEAPKLPLKEKTIKGEVGRKEVLKSFETYLEEFRTKGGKVKELPTIKSDTAEVIGKLSAKKARDQSIADLGVDVSVRKGLKAPGEKGVEDLGKELEIESEFLGSILGGVQKFFKRKVSKAERGEPTQLEMKRKTSWWDEEKPWKDLGKPELGRAIKNIYSKMEAVEVWGHGQLKTLAKIGQTGKMGVLKRPFKKGKGYTKDDMSNIPLYAEDIPRFKKLLKEEQDKLRQGVAFLRKFLKEGQRRYREEYGVNPDFKGNMMDSFNKNSVAMLDTIGQITAGEVKRFTKADLAKLGITLPRGMKFKPKNMKQVTSILKKAMGENKEIVKRLEKLDYVHIPYGMWFEQGLMTNRGASIKALALDNLKKRTTLSIQSLVDAGAIVKSDINVFDIIMSYSRKMAKDFALLDVRKSAMAEGMISKKKLPGFERIDPRRAPLFGKDWLHPAFKDWLYDFRVSTVNQTRVDKMFSLVKMWRFAKPGFLAYYDLQQHAVARNIGWLNPIGIGKDFSKALYLILKKPPEYYEILERGISSKPFDLPWKTTMELVDKLKGTTAGDVLRSIARQGVHPLKTSYEALWETAWWGDQFIRLVTNNMFLRRGASPWEAAQTAAFIHSDYAGVPMATRRSMQKILFTGTFKITMGKLYASMIKQMARVPYKLVTGGRKDLTFAEKEVAKAGYATVFGAMVGYDTLMTKIFGWKRDQFAIRYYKEIQTPEGAKEVVHVLASPLTMIPKYWSKFNRLMLTDYYSNDKLKGGIETFKWDLHPVYNISYSIINNKNPAGNMIYDPIGDSWGTIIGKSTRYAVRQSLAVLDYVAKQDDQEKAWKHYQKDVGKLFSWLAKPASFTYLRNTGIDRLRAKKDHLDRDFSKLKYRMQYGKRANGKPYTEADFRKLQIGMMNKTDQILKQIIAIEKEEYREALRRDKKEIAQETGARIKKSKPLTAPSGR